MTKYIFCSLLIYCLFLANNCNTPTPQRYLDLAVTNANVLAGFANNALSVELETPPVKLKERSGKVILMTRQEMIENKIRFSKEMLIDLADIKTTADARDIISSSIALHEFVIHVYETDYMLLAKLYDEDAAKEKIIALDTAIKNKYAGMFSLHYENLIRGGKLYASRHKIIIPSNI